MSYTKITKLHIVAVTMVIANPEGKFLVVKRSEREIAHPGKWALPGGKMEDDDSVMATLKKEAKEEAGLEIEDRKVYLNDAHFIRPDAQTVKVFTYLVFAKAFDVKISPDFTDYKWINLDEVDRLDCLVNLKFELVRAEKYLRKTLASVD